MAYGIAAGLKTRDMLAASGPGLDAFSYHHYGASSQRCAAMGAQTTAAAALSEAWLARTDETLAFYRALRDEFAYFATCALNGKTPNMGRPEDAAAALEATLAAEESARTGNVIRIGGN